VLLLSKGEVLLGRVGVTHEVVKWVLDDGAQMMLLLVGAALAALYLPWTLGVYYLNWAVLPVSFTPRIRGGQVKHLGVL
jgi:hypothetical protein